MIRLALAQINVTVGDLDGNVALIESFMCDARSQDADLVVFPELVLCGYPPEDLLYKKYFIEDNKRALQVLAEKVNGLTAVVGFVDQNEQGVYNAAAVLSDGQMKGIYHKEELPNYGVFDEKRYFKEGENHNIYALGYDHFAVNICEDIWMDEGVYQRQAKQGASLILNLSSSPFDVEKQHKRTQLIQKRAEQTNAFIAYVNLVGGQDELVFDGGSFVMNPQGRVLAQAELFQEQLVLCDLDVSSSRERKYKSFDIVKVSGSFQKNKKALALRNAEPLDELTSVYQALVVGTRDYVQKNGFQKVVIGLSGGIDSALVAKIAVDALGRENVTGVTMPSPYTSSETKQDAQKLADHVGITCLEIPIASIFTAYLETLKTAFDQTAPNIAEENIQARIRGNILMALSNKFGWLVLTTGNKSEIAVGYCTLYGDMCGGFAVIKDVPKTMVYALSKWVNQDKEWIPYSIIERAPSAELRPNQTDQDSLPPYAQLDQILKGYVEDHQAQDVLAQQWGEDIVADVIGKVDFNEYKRRQAPPGIKITQRAFGKDRRLPITNKYRHQKRKSS